MYATTESPLVVDLSMDDVTTLISYIITTHFQGLNLAIIPYSSSDKKISYKMK
jgi:hypothetical protein